MAYSIRPRTGLLLLTAGTLACVSMFAGAHDEDVRKINDGAGAPVNMPPVTGRVFRDTDAVPAGTLQYVPGGATQESGNFTFENMELLSWIPLTSFPGTQTRGNDCWGYVSPSGREYAIMGLECGFSFVEVTDPLNPVQIQYIASTCSVWHDVKVIGAYAYGVADSTGNGLNVMDMSDIDNGNVTLVQNVTTGGMNTAHNIVSNPTTGYVYTTGGNIANGGLTAWDVATNPASPAIAGSWNNFYVHDAVVVSYDSGPYAGKEIAFTCGGTSGGWNNTGLRIVDVTNKSAMTTIGQTFWTNPEYSHQCWISEDKQYLYLGDELDEQGQGIPTRTLVVDISDLNNPTIASEFTSGLPAIDHNQYVRDGYLFQANYTTGIRVWKLDNALNPTLAGWFDTYPENDNPSFTGAWSVYPFFPSGNIIISDIKRGMFMVRMECAADCDANGTLNVFDYICFGNDYAAGGVYSDCDGNSVHNVFDYICYGNLYAGGCPLQ